MPRRSTATTATDPRQHLIATAAALGLLALAGTALWAGTGHAAPADASTKPPKAAPAGTAQRSSTASYLVGRIAQGAGDWDIAARNLSAALAADPDNAQLARRTFLLHLGEGNRAEALRLARLLEGAEADSQLAHVLLLSDDIAAGRVAAAEARLPRLATDGLARFVTPILTAWTHAAAGRPDAALDALAPLDQAAGIRPLKLLQMALIQDMTGNSPEADRLYAELAGSGTNLRLVQLTGNFLERQGRMAEARALYTEVVQAGGGSSSAAADALAALAARQRKGTKPAPLVPDAKTGLAEALFDLATILHQEGAGEMSLLYGRMALGLVPDMPLARLMLGDVLAGRDRHAAALAEYKAVTAPAGLAWAARLRQADMLKRLDREAEAVTLLTAMAAERPDRSDPAVRLGDIDRMAGRHEAAIRHYDEALARDSRAGRQDWVAYYLRAMALDGAKRWPQAEADLKRALELNPDHPSVLNYLGYSWVDRGERLEEALGLIRRAVAQRPEDGHIVDSLGWALFRMGDYAGAIVELERAVELEPLDPTINDHLGDAYWAAGRHQEARFQWRRAAQQAGADPDLREAAERKLKHGLPQPKTAGLPEGR